MYAIIETGGKQYRVETGLVIRVEKMDVPVGEKVVFQRVVMAGADGKVLAGPEAGRVKVEGTVLGHGKGKKIVVFKYRPKKGYHRKRGHRQPFTEIRVDSISGIPGSGKPAAGKAGKDEGHDSEGSD